MSLTRHSTGFHRTSSTVHSVLQLMEGCQIPFARVRGAARVLSWPASVHSIYQRTIRDSGSTVAKRALLRR